MGVKYEYKFCLNFIPANMHVANIGVKFGGCGINLEKARKKIDNIASNIKCSFFIVTIIQRKDKLWI